MAKTPMERLRDGDLARMVRWYAPRLLGRIWVRTVLSNVFGQYADQRLLQAATDQVDEQTLVDRYNYAKPNPADAGSSIPLDEAGGYWVDYIADTGDGFESTYAMAYLLAQENLQLKAGTILPRGDLVVFGGDQAYPQATREEYNNRFIMPFRWAHSSEAPKRKAFAIPGNHDWYDGLAAFDSLFCTARDKLSQGTGNTFGGLEFKQHRSYWAIKMPHNWWLWGADIQFSKYLDNAQVNYFETIARTMGPEDNIVICISEPAWLLAERQGTDEEENLFKLATIVRSHGAKVAAVVAGDWHHYNRYHADNIGAHFFTAGGGGAFLHPTHILRDEISVNWPVDRVDDAPLSPPATAPQDAKGVGAHGEKWQSKKIDMQLRAFAQPGGVASLAQDIAEDIDIGNVMAPQSTPTAEKPRTSPRAPKVYPGKWTSRRLSLRNVFFPFYNKGFAAAIGLIYWLITWRFHGVVNNYDISAGKINEVSTTTYLSVLKFMPLYVVQATFSITFVAFLAAFIFVLMWYVDATRKKGIKRYLAKGIIGLSHAALHLVAMFAIFLGLMVVNNALAPKVETLVESVVQSKRAQEGMVGEVVQETFKPLSESRYEQRRLRRQQRESRRQGETRSYVGPEDLRPLRPLTGASTRVERSAIREVVGLLYPFQMMLVGGLIGGTIWGLYWVFAGIFLRMHSEDAFAALRIRHFKNFLRMRFDPDKLTIYPIGVKRLPSRDGWRDAADGGEGLSNKPLLVPRGKLAPELIEEPIVIYSGRPISPGP